ncbi:MAG: tripartite tricarboxylate transporter TctB family protein [Betaproteobacteria bacterium]|nr:tripartite tricarboxylate transporter TctB family protein [Betaproteobacteria bacterium]
MAGNARTIRALPYAIVGAAAGYLYYVASHFQFHARAGTLGPDFWPEAILALMIAACVYEVVKIAGFGARAGEVGGVLEEIVEESAEKHADVGPVSAPRESHPWLLPLGMGATILYVLAVPLLGFFLATTIYLAAFMVIGGYRRRGVIASVSLIGTLLLLFIFMKLVYVSLPIGQEPFSRVTLFLMQVMGIR